MAKVNARLEEARKAYREALDAARQTPSPETWAKLLAAGKELSACEDAKGSGKRSRAPKGESLPDLETLE